MQLIGKGAFTKAYLCEDNSVFLKSECQIKECMSFGWFPDSYLFPKINGTDNMGEYTMKYYPKVTSLKSSLEPRQYRFYKLLKGLSIRWAHNKYDLYNEWHKAFESIPDEFAEERDSILEALDACANYGSDINFEISPRNVAVDNGKLVLLDCFFLISNLNEVKSRKSKRH